MNYEQKYKEALKVIESLYNVVRYQSSSDALLVSQTIKKAFPELCESEDERIKKELISFFTKRDEFTKSEPFNGLSSKQIISWLEKQDEQKPADKVEPKFNIGDTIKYIGEREEFSKEKHTIKEILDDCYLTIDDVYIPFKFENCYILVNQNHTWSKEDELMIQDAIHWINEFQKSNRCKDENDMQNSVTCENWLKSIKDRVQPQPKQEWSKEDSEMFQRIISDCEQKYVLLPNEVDWLKSFKPNHWKPSDEQLSAIMDSAQGLYQCKEKEVLLDLYEQLKNL